MHIAQQLLLKARLDLDEALYEKISQRLDDIGRPEWNQIESLFIEGLQLDNTRTVSVYIRYCIHFNYELDFIFYLQHEDVGIRGAALKYCIAKGIYQIPIEVLIQEKSLYNQEDVAKILHFFADTNIKDIFNDLVDKESLFLYFIELLQPEDFWKSGFYFNHLSKCCFHGDSFIKRFACHLLYPLCINQQEDVFSKIKSQIYNPSQFIPDNECQLLIAYALFACNVDDALKLEIVSKWKNENIYKLIKRLGNNNNLIHKLTKIRDVSLCHEIMPIIQHFDPKQQKEIILKMLDLFGLDSIVYVELDLICEEAKCSAMTYAIYLLSGDLQDVALGLAVFTKLCISGSRFGMLLKYTDESYLMNIRNAAYACIQLYLNTNWKIIDLKKFTNIFKNGFQDESDIRLISAQSLLFITENTGLYLDAEWVYEIIYKEDSELVAFYLAQCVGTIDDKLKKLLVSYHDAKVNALCGIHEELDQVDWLLSVDNVVHQDCY